MCRVKKFIRCVRKAGVLTALLSALWVAPVFAQDFSYTGGIKEYEVPTTGYYILEVYGAEGGGWGNHDKAPGGYAKGVKYLTAGTKLYIGCGNRGYDYNKSPSGNGYNGGATSSTDYSRQRGGSGGATHIAINTNRGVLSKYSDYRNEILIVAGGAGSNGWWGAGWPTGGGREGAGGLGIAKRNMDSADDLIYPISGTQTGTGTAPTYGFVPGGFGYGGRATSYGGSGGGGWYGGMGTRDTYGGIIFFDSHGGGGSGYIGGVSNGSWGTGTWHSSGFAKVYLCPHSTVGYRQIANNYSNHEKYCTYCGAGLGNEAHTGIGDISGGKGCTKCQYPAYYLDLNGNVNGTGQVNTIGGGTVTVKVTGNPTATSTSVTDYYALHYKGSPYSMTNASTATGYTFNGVSSGSASGTVTGNLSVVFKYTRNNYSVSYNLNGGTMSGQVTSYHVESASFTLPKPTRAGYTFKGWTGSNGTTPQTTVTVAKGSTGNKSYTANWTPVNYTITFNGNGGTSTSKSSPYWSTLGNTNTDILNQGFIIPPNGAGADTPKMSKQVVSDSSAILKSAIKIARTSAGTVSAGFYYPGELMGGKLPVGQKYTITVRAKGQGTWRVGQEQGGVQSLALTSSYQTFQWEYTTNNGQYYAFVFYDSTLAANDYIQFEPPIIRAGGISTLPTSTRTGYIFNGWYTAASGGTKINESQMVTGAATYYAQWTPIKYKVQFNSNGGTGTMATQEFTYDVSTNLTKNAFTRTGCEFMGWSTSAKEPNVDEATCKSYVAYADKAAVLNKATTNGATIQLYAVWKLLDFDIYLKFDTGNGLQEETHPVRFGYGIGYLKPLPTPEKDGYRFIGWYTEDVNGGNQITDSTIVTSVDQISLYAHWDKIIQFDTVSINKNNELAILGKDRNVFALGTKDSNKQLVKDDKFKVEFDLNGKQIKDVDFSENTMKVLTSDGVVYKLNELKVNSTTSVMNNNVALLQSGNIFLTLDNRVTDMSMLNGLTNGTCLAIAHNGNYTLLVKVIENGVERIKVVTK